MSTIQNNGSKLSFVATRYKCYPGDHISFSIRVEVDAVLPNLELIIEVPTHLVIEGSEQTPSDLSKADYLIDEIGEMHMIRWVVDKPVAQSNFEIVVTVPTTIFENLDSSFEDDIRGSQRDSAEIHSSARLMAAGKTLIKEYITIHVAKHSAFLCYLPAIYEQDSDFINQYLIIAEGFLQSIQQQVDQIEYYFDPWLAPDQVLPFLASWFDWKFDSDWPDPDSEPIAWQRQIIQSLLQIHRQRGTEQGLQLYLERYFRLSAGEVKVKIHSYTLQGFSLGDENAKLGQGIALYKEVRQPHTFEVTISLPAQYAGNQPFADQVRERAARIIAAEKPAHTVLTALNIAVDPLQIAL